MEEKKKMPFHLTVTDNETGETLQDLDFDALIGAAHIGKEEAAGLFVTRCNALALAGTTRAVENTLERVRQTEPQLRLVEMFTRAKIEKEESKKYFE